MAAALAALAERTFRDTFAKDNSADDMEAYVRASFSPERVRAELADPAHTFLLAFLEPAGAPIGYAKLKAAAADPSVTGPAPIELERIYVDAQAIGRGIGAALMRASLDTARSGGYQTVWLGVWEHNPRAIAFYERWGFRTVGDHAFRLGSAEQTDLIMERPVEQQKSGRDSAASCGGARTARRRRPRARRRSSTTIRCRRSRPRAR
jgi:ribosomal protein S18 acetylase RimI-like enzyme